MTTTLKKFFLLESASGILLIIAALLALLLANSPLASYYHDFLATDIQVRIASLDLHKPLFLWINDGLMALFFLLIGMEVKREMIDGALSTRAQAVFPAIAALGGMLAPALIYLLLNQGNPETQSGWAIPAATDIAFALAVLGLLGKRVPLSMRIFLTALAVVDDIGGIIIIALFYSGEIAFEPLLISLALLALLYVGGRMRVNNIAFYYIIGFFVWMLFLESGIHPTIAGVLVAFTVPARPVVKLDDWRSAIILEQLVPGEYYWYLNFDF